MITQETFNAMVNAANVGEFVASEKTEGIFKCNILSISKKLKNGFDIVFKFIERKVVDTKTSLDGTVVQEIKITRHRDDDDGHDLRVYYNALTVNDLKSAILSFKELVK